MPRSHLRRSGRIAGLLLIACCVEGEPRSTSLLAASPGLPRFQEPTAIAVPGGILNAAGGNLLVRRTDLAIDTKLGTFEIGAAYNSKTQRWLWSFDARYDGGTFVDPAGTVHPALWTWPDGELISGSVWIKLDPSRIRSLGGLVHEFDAGGRLAAVHWASDPYPRLDHVAQLIAGAPRTTEIRQCGAPGACSPLATLSYDASGRVVSIVDRAGRIADFTYDANGGLATARDPLDVERGLPGFRYEYRDDQRLFAITSSEGERIEYSWHWNQGRITEVRAIGAEGAVHRFEYAVDGDAYAPFTTAYVDPLGHRTLYRIDGAQRLRRVTLPTGEVTTREWSGVEPSRLVRPGGALTSWQYVDSDEVIRTEPSGNAVRFEFQLGTGEDRSAPFRRPIRRIDDSLGVVERRGYDAKGRVAWIGYGAGERTSFAWSAENLRARRTGPDGIAVVYSGYGEHGHAQSVSVGGEVATRVFDAVGNPVSTSGLERLDTRPGGEISRGYDGDRNLAEIVLADLPAGGPASAESIRIEWRSDRRLLAIERPGGNDHELDYDLLGRRVARRERSGGAWVTTHYEVDALGRTVAEALPNGMRREWTHDASGRPLGLAARRDGATEGELSVAWADDRPAAASDSLAGGAETFEWDSAGELAAIAFPGGERLEIERDLRGRTVRETYRKADGSVLREIGFAHDGADRRTRTTEDGALLVEHGYAQGRLATTLFGSGLLRTYAYEPATGLLAGATSVRAGGSVVEATALSLLRLDAAGEVRLVAETASAGPAAATTREEYALGPLGGEGKRLVAWSDGTAEHPTASDHLANATLSGGDAFLYDAERGRLLARTEAATGEPLVDYAWDAAGFCIARGGVPIAWTALGRIAAIGSEASFEWDLQGRPVRRVVAGLEVRFLFGGRVETDAAGVLQRLDLGEVVLHLETGEHRYRHFDFRGNVKLESDDAGLPAFHVRYGPYGIDATFGAGDGAATFAGGRAVGELVLVGARVLDPAAGRFLAPDPVLQLVNQYAYTLANPIAFWDPDGREFKLSGFMYGALGAGGAAVTGTAVGGGSLGFFLGGIPGALIGLAIAEAIYQHLNPGERLFSLQDAIEAATPLYVAPPARGKSGDHSGGALDAPASPAPDSGAATPGFTSSGFHFSAWAAGSGSGAIGGGWGGF